MLRYVKITQGNFPTESHDVQSDGYVSYEGTCSSSYYYFRVPCVDFNTNSWCDGYGLFTTYYCGNHSHTTWYKGYVGSSFTWTDTSTSSNIRVDGVCIEGKAQFWTGKWHDQGTYSIVCYEIGHSNATTAYNYIAQKGYKFAGVSTTAAAQTSGYDTSGYCNSYVYPGTNYLQHLMPIP